VLDPNVKDTYTRRQWDPTQHEAGMEQLETMVFAIALDNNQFN